MSAASLSWALASRADDVMRAAQLAACLEVCGYPKPGNVHRLRNLGELRFEHFIAGAIAIGPAIREASMKGIRHVLDGLKLGDVRLGSLMLRAVSDMIGWQRGGNTHLGTIVLFTPLAVSAGMCIAEACEFNLKLLREGFVETVKATTSLDTVDFYKAVRLANPKGMGKVRGLKPPDVMDDRFEAKILAEDVTLYEAMAECSDWDEVASEFVSGLEVTVKLGYPTLMKVFEETKDINTATVHTYLTILAHHPDTYVARCVGLKYSDDVREAVKAGLAEAKRISEEAGEIMKLGGLLTEDGRRALNELDRNLAERGLNPGSTADLVATALFTAILTGLRS